ncbi:UDP-N-acetylmuramyl pentapeptide phosphotransferase/UDP-N-acetylglucosamine-1-phosphate transferase [Pedobacter psychrotolerans]|uniref:UDP-GlcNAc--UDP-phosphate GlcNAc-1-phosphate transferase n=1 Tax=Pedobacter psychrotolerans TaxID=1843235 RepID=A0A4R2HGK3_9SPHI|nr:glycosyltransferase family 4 protein [Pedobacter psychrotolerans]TCO27214.1 UDP-N-acetylmuramyl pentapeptide phosphotransferase/UDP-N-acetylglucosamine-1-phosphate transferase [Pedobacter psychrotolerans]GGE59842.1 UDP-GlcNAc--UDP-phosphate GlcNAc-1-phosphate transferase [Pedobacter psychrotolerans]
MIDFTLILFTVVLFGVMLVYLRIADQNNIIDRPNARSSHSIHTIRGGGIIFPLALLLEFVFSGFEYGWFILGLVLISTISFFDDLKPQKARLRFSIHLLAVAFMFYQLQLFYFPWYVIMLALFFVIGSINAVNFMDGINGMTGGYALLTLLTFYYVNFNIIFFIDDRLLLVAIIAVVVFNYFNFRKVARCFAGDVGSVSIAFIILFFMLQLILVTQNFSYILLMLIYGLDVVTTMMFRIIRRENVFEAHRTHFYQFLANEKKIPHLGVALAYVMAQLLVNIWVIYWSVNKISYLALVLVITGTFIVVCRLMIQGKRQLIDRTPVENS